MVNISTGADYLKQNIGTIGIGGAGVIVGAGMGAIAGYVIAKKKSKTRRKTTKRRSAGSGRRRKLKFGSKAYRKRYLHHRRGKQKKPHTAGKRKDTSHKRIRYTKNNQPYIILASGKARFISKRSVSSSRKRKGGKY